jgi:hypothetical protein
MGQLESLRELSIAKIVSNKKNKKTKKKKQKQRKKRKCMPWLLHLIGSPINSEMLIHLCWNYFEAS